MANSIPLKLLLQHKDTDTPNAKWRLTALIDAETVRDMLLELENKPGSQIFVSADMPHEHMEVHVEICEVGRPLSGLRFTQHLTENGWTTSHITLLKS